MNIQIIIRIILFIKYIYIILNCLCDMLRSHEKTIAGKKQICCACGVDDFNFLYK